jgi:hypothetical protein
VGLFVGARGVLSAGRRRRSIKEAFDAGRLRLLREDSNLIRFRRDDNRVLGSVVRNFRARPPLRSLYGAIGKVFPYDGRGWMAAQGAISVSLTRRDFEDFAVFAALEGPFARTVVFRRIQILLLPAAVVLLLALLAFDLDASMLVSGFGAVSPWLRSLTLVLAAIVVVAWLGLPRAVRVWVRRGIATPRYDALLQPFALSLNTAGIACETTSGEVVTPWPAIKAVSVVDTAIYAFIAPFQAIIIPRRAFADDAAFDDFVTALSAYQPQAGSDWTLTKTAPSRRRVVAASAFGVFGALFVVALCLCYLGTTKEFFIATFDVHLKRAPVEAAIIEADPVLRAQVLRVTADAFAMGGWDAANDALNGLMDAREAEINWTYVVLADDRSVVALWRAYRDVGKALADSSPKTCRSYLNDGGDAPSGSPGLKTASDRKAAAYRSGSANLVKGMAPVFPSNETARSLYDRAMALGSPFSVAEWNVIVHQAAKSPDTPNEIVCTARIKFFDKILSLPEHDAAQLIRYEWAPPIAWQLSATGRLS